MKWELLDYFMLGVFIFLIIGLVHIVFRAHM